MNDWFEAEQRVERAQQLSESHCFAEALSELDVALSINPNNALWHAQRGYLLEELDRAAEAVEAYQRSLQLEGGDQDVSLALGAALAHLGKFALALTVFEDLARLYPELEPTYCHRILVYAELGRHERAEEMFYMAQELDDACPHCFYHMGGSLFSREQFDKAIYCWERVIELEPGYIGVNRRIAQAFEAKGELDRAREYFLRELRDDPGNTDLLFELAELTLASGKLPAAAAKFEQIIELDPDHAAAYFALGSVLLQIGQPQAALDALESAAVAAEPDEMLHGLDARAGEALLLLGRFAEARIRLNKAVELAPNDSRLVTLLGDVLFKLKKGDAVGDCYRKALAIEPTSPIAHYRLGLCLLEAGRPADALRHHLDALQSRSDFVEAMHASTLALLELGQWRRARIMVDRAISTKSSPELLALRARLWRFRLRRYLGRLRHPFAR
jgi:tetratricopeptide (TPR) repeat protein